MGAGSWELPPRPARLLLPRFSCCLLREASWDGYPAGFMHFEGAEGGKFMAAFMRSMRLSAYAEKITEAI